MRIGELSRATGVEIETIRYYEKTGMLPNPVRLSNGYRDYGKEQLERLAFIRQCRAMSMSLADIARLLDFQQGAPADCNDINHLIDRHLSQIRARIESMQTLEKKLVALRTSCSEGRTTTDCGILHGLALAARDQCANKGAR